MIIRRSASAARPETILHDIPAPIGQPKNEPLPLTYVYSDETLDWYATEDDLGALEAQAEAWRVARQAALAAARLAETDYVSDKARRQNRRINPAWDSWRDDLAKIVNGSGEEIPPEPERWAEDGNSIQAPPVRDEPSTVPSAPERAEEPDPEFDNLRAVLIEADETEDLAIKRLAEQFRDLRSKFVGNLHMDESEKERFRILSTKAAQTWLRI